MAPRSLPCAWVFGIISSEMTYSLLPPHHHAHEVRISRSQSEHITAALPLISRSRSEHITLARQAYHGGFAAYITRTKCAYHVCDSKHKFISKYESQMANGFGAEFVARAPKAYLHTTRGSERQKQTKLKRKGRKALRLFNLK